MQIITQKKSEKIGIALQLVLIYLLAAALPITGLAIFFFKEYESSLRGSLLESLDNIADKKVAQIEAYIDERLKDTRVNSQRVIIRNGMDTLGRLFRARGLQSPSYVDAATKLKDSLDARNVMEGYYDLLLIDMDSNVVFSYKRENDLGVRLRDAALRNTPLGLAAERALSQGKATISMFKAYAPSDGRPAAFLVAPINVNEVRRGAVAMQIDIDHMTNVALDRIGLKNSGETLLAQREDGDALFVAPLRRIAQSGFGLRIPFQDAAQPMRNALSKQSGRGIAQDYAGISSAAAWRYLPMLDWGMVVKIDADEVFAPLHAMQRVTIWALILTLFASGSAAVFLGRRLARPIVQLTGAAERVAAGDLTPRVSVEGEGELQRLAVAFNAMTNSLTDARATLEQKVAARTAELEAYKNDLERRVTERTRDLHDAQRIARIGSFLWDMRNDDMWWSDNVRVLLGYTTHDIKPSRDAFFAPLHPEDASTVRDKLRENLANTAAHAKGGDVALPGLDYRIVRPDGAVHWLRAEGMVELDAGWQPARVRGTVQDITERVQFEQELIAAKNTAERANLAKSEFLARMSHELRTPLNAILGFSQILELAGLDVENTAQVREIRGAGEHLLSLINDLLDITRLDVNQLSIALAPVPIGRIVAQAIRLTQPTVNQRKLQLHNECVDDQWVLADAVRLRQIMVNLLTNAAKYNTPDGYIRITCDTPRAGWLRINVTDSGIGIAPEKLGLLFRPFERLGVAESTAQEGTGIGLSLCKGLTNLMGGEIGAHSTPGKGSTFWVELPLAEAKADTPTPPRAFSRATRSVLYIEDNPVNLRVVEAMLARQPHLSLISAGNGEAGLRLARERRPDVILLDINLPGMDGYQVMEKLRAMPETNAITVIALSADAMPHHIKRGMDAGFAHYLTKPVQLHALLTAIGVQTPIQ